MKPEARTHHMIDRLRTERDELRVRMHLARAELREEWKILEKKWERLERRLEKAGSDAIAASRDVGGAAGTVAEEIAAAYRRIRERLH